MQIFDITVLKLHTSLRPPFSFRNHRCEVTLAKARTKAFKPKEAKSRPMPAFRLKINIKSKPLAVFSQKVMPDIPYIPSVCPFYYTARGSLHF